MAGVAAPINRSPRSLAAQTGWVGKRSRSLLYKYPRSAPYFCWNLLTTPSAPLRNGAFLLRRSHPSLKTEGNELASALIDLRVQSCSDLLGTRYWNCTRLLTLVMVKAHVGALLTRPKEIRLGYQPSSTLKKPEYSTRIGSLFPI